MPHIAPTTCIERKNEDSVAGSVGAIEASSVLRPRPLLPRYWVGVHMDANLIRDTKITECNERISVFHSLTLCISIYIFFYIYIRTLTSSGYLFCFLFLEQMFSFLFVVVVIVIVF